MTKFIDNPRQPKTQVAPPLSRNQTLAAEELSKRLHFTEYQELAMETARPDTAKNELYHLLLGLTGEVGEIMEKAKKEVRDNDSKFGADFRLDLMHELGDVLWYVAVLANYFYIDLNLVANKNIEKLQSRKRRGKLEGSGDYR